MADKGNKNKSETTRQGFTLDSKASNSGDISIQASENNNSLVISNDNNAEFDNLEATVQFDNEGNNAQVSLSGENNNDTGLQFSGDNSNASLQFSGEEMTKQSNEEQPVFEIHELGGELIEEPTSVTEPEEVNYEKQISQKNSDNPFDNNDETSIRDESYINNIQNSSDFASDDYNSNVTEFSNDGTFSFGGDDVITSIEEQDYIDPDTITEQMTSVMDSVAAEEYDNTNKVIKNQENEEDKNTVVGDNTYLAQEQKDQNASIESSSEKVKAKVQVEAIENQIRNDSEIKFRNTEHIVAGADSNESFIIDEVENDDIEINIEDNEVLTKNVEAKNNTEEVNEINKIKQKENGKEQNLPVKEVTVDEQKQLKDSYKSKSTDIPDKVNKSKQKQNDKEKAKKQLDNNKESILDNNEKNENIKSNKGAASVKKTGAKNKSIIQNQGKSEIESAKSKLNTKLEEANNSPVKSTNSINEIIKEKRKRTAIKNPVTIQHNKKVKAHLVMLSTYGIFKVLHESFKFEDTCLIQFEAGKKLKKVYVEDGRISLILSNLVNETFLNYLKIIKHKSIIKLGKIEYNSFVSPRKEAEDLLNNGLLSIVEFFKLLRSYQLWLLNDLVCWSQAVCKKTAELSPLESRIPVCESIPALLVDDLLQITNTDSLELLLGPIDVVPDQDIHFSASEWGGNIEGYEEVIGLIDGKRNITDIVFESSLEPESTIRLLSIIRLFSDTKDMTFPIRSERNDDLAVDEDVITPFFDIASEIEPDELDKIDNNQVLETENINDSQKNNSNILEYSEKPDVNEVKQTSKILVEEDETVKIDLNSDYISAKSVVDNINSVKQDNDYSIKKSNLQVDNKNTFIKAESNAESRISNITPWNNMLKEYGSLEAAVKTLNDLLEFCENTDYFGILGLNDSATDKDINNMFKDIMSVFDNWISRFDFRNDIDKIEDIQLMVSDAANILSDSNIKEDYTNKLH